MPLPNITLGKARRCKAKCKARGDQCRNPAAYGMPVCRYHGAKRPETICRGKDHGHYHHGRETLEAKAERSRRLAELRELEALSFVFGLVANDAARWRGRKPRDVL